MPKNSSAFGDVQISPLDGRFDLRSPSGTMPISDFRLVLNASMNELGKRCRRPQWRKYGAGSPYGFNNQDLHDRLIGVQYYCDDNTPSNCTCPNTANCLILQDYEYGVVLENCVDGADSSARPWDGIIKRSGDCSWGFSYGSRSFGGKDFAAIVSVKSCTDGINIYELEITVRLDDGTGLIVWKGESTSTPVGTYSRTNGCDETPTVVLVNCSACDAPVLTASPPSGSEVSTGTYISLFATDGAVIFFTTDGSTPDNTSEMYAGPFPISESTTVRAIAYTGTCVSSVSVFEYTATDGLLFEFTCDSEDQAGVFFEFNPNGSADHNWRLTFSLPALDIVRLEIYETDTDGLWVTGQAWATDNPVYPAELDGGSFSIYPLVIYEGTTQINTQYETTVAPAIFGSDHVWMLYGQPFVPNVGYFKIILTYNNGLEERQVFSVIPNECYYYY